jgi:hypothetical protein
MPQGNKSSRPDKQQQEAEPIEAGQEENGVGTKAAEARIWAAANKLASDGKDQFPEKQE